MNQRDKQNNVTDNEKKLNPNTIPMLKENQTGKPSTTYRYMTDKRMDQIAKENRTPGAPN